MDCIHDLAYLNKLCSQMQQLEYYSVTKRQVILGSRVRDVESYLPARKKYLSQIKVPQGAVSVADTSPY